MIHGYHIMPPSQQEFSQEFYHLVVPAASMALECYCRDFISIIYAAQHLVDCGKAFRTLMAPTRPPKYRRRKPCFLPHCEKMFKFELSDYIAYEVERDRFFQYPHARAALLEGGITWRLAMLSLGAQDTLNGPSDSAHDFGEVFTLSDGTKLVDDCLTDNECDLISGTYIIYTGVFVHYILRCFDIKATVGMGKQVAEKSWWPKQSTWIASCENIGYWTEAAEQ
jgi:hypothetical protein